MADYIPDPDPAFDLWFANFKAYATANAVALGLTPAQVADLAAASGTWIAAYGAVDVAKIAAKAAVAAKDTARDTAEDLVRSQFCIGDVIMWSRG